MLAEKKYKRLAQVVETIIPSKLERTFAPTREVGTEKTFLPNKMKSSRAKKPLSKNYSLQHCKTSSTKPVAVANLIKTWHSKHKNHRLDFQTARYQTQTRCCFLTFMTVSVANYCLATPNRQWLLWPPESPGECAILGRHVFLSSDRMRSTSM